MSRATVTGRAAMGMDLRFTPAGKAVGTVRIAENHRRKDGQQWVDDGTTWYRVTVWGDRAETLAEHVEKGTLLLVVGDLRTTEYTRRDGATDRGLEITASEVGIIPPRDRAKVARDAVSEAFPGAVEEPPAEWGTW